MATTSVDWTCPGYQRAVAACLVKGAYALERDRRKKRQDAPAWWEKYHFELKHKLTDHDDADSSIFGAIYEFKPPTPIQNAPKIVIALRGTQLKRKTFLQDIKLDLKIFANYLERTPRCKIAMRAVEEMVSADASRNLWLVGHSLGSAMAMIAGKNMAKGGINLETFLFNPPYPSAILIELIGSRTAKKVCGFLNSMLRAGVAWTMEGRREQSRDYFAQISLWVPYLFVNRDDIICSGYIEYFKRREIMEDFGLGCIERLATRNSVRALASGSESEPFELLPSAKLAVNYLDPNLRGHLKRKKQAHGIDQWLSQDLSLQTKEYHYN